MAFGRITVTMVKIYIAKKLDISDISETRGRFTAPIWMNFQRFS